MDERKREKCFLFFIYIFTILTVDWADEEHQHQTSISNFKIQNISYDVNVCYLKARF